MLMLNMVLSIFHMPEVIRRLSEQACHRHIEMSVYIIGGFPQTTLFLHIYSTNQFLLLLWAKTSIKRTNRTSSSSPQVGVLPCCVQFLFGDGVAAHCAVTPTWPVSWVFPAPQVSPPALLCPLLSQSAEEIRIMVKPEKPLPLADLAN